MINYGSVNTHHPLNPSIHAGLEIFGKEVAMMNGLTLVCIAIVIFAFAYLFYGRWLVKTWGIEPDAKTPAYRFEDGRDFAPASRFTVFAHSFLQLRAQALSRARLLPLCLVGFLHSYGLL